MYSVLCLAVAWYYLFTLNLYPYSGPIVEAGDILKLKTQFLCLAQVKQYSSPYFIGFKGRFHFFSQCSKHSNILSISFLRSIYFNSTKASDSINSL